jgi:putative endonuclease
MALYHVYILSRWTRTLYVGVTGNLTRRISQHREGKHGFTSRYRITRLVYVETTTDVMAAIAREKQIKSWRRARKMDLIQSMNPEWADLATGVVEGGA